MLNLVHQYIHRSGASAGCSAFFVLNSVGSCFGYLQPLTSLSYTTHSAFQSCSTTQSCGISWGLSFNFLSKYTRFSGPFKGSLPAVPPLLLHSWGFNPLRPISSGGLQHLLPDAVAWRILAARAASSHQKGVVKCYQELLATHNLNTLLPHPVLGSFLSKRILPLRLIWRGKTTFRFAY